MPKLALVDVAICVLGYLIGFELYEMVVIIGVRVVIVVLFILI